MKKTYKQAELFMHALESDVILASNTETEVHGTDNVIEWFDGGMGVGL